MKRESELVERRRMQGSWGKSGRKRGSLWSPWGSLSGEGRGIVHPVARGGASCCLSGSQRSSPVACQSAVQGPEALMVREMLCGKMSKN